MRQTHYGASRLVLSLDVGATFSAVAYQYLQKNMDMPNPVNVCGWPGSQSAHLVKTPSYILYDGETPVAFGLAAAEEHELIGDTLIKNFKLALHPQWMQDQASERVAGLRPGSRTSLGFEKPDIPDNLNLAKIYQDYITYLLKRAQESFSDSHFQGDKLWKELLPSARFIIGCPNGWSASEKKFLTDALIATAFCTKDTSITVVTEGEASLHYLLNTANATVPLENGATFIVCDAGGSTVDTIVYECVDAATLKFVEVGAADCLQKGGIYVSRGIENVLTRAFAASAKFNRQSASNVSSAMAEFDTTLKTRWDGTKKGDEKLRFSHNFADTDEAAGIKQGRIIIKADDLNRSFDTCVLHIVQRLKSKIIDGKGRKVKSLMLVGGLGDSPHLQRALKEAFMSSDLDVPVLFPAASDPGEKAVSAGGVWLATRRNAVTGRGSLFYYGVQVDVPYDEDDVEHGQRPRKDIKTGSDGSRWISSAFKQLIGKDEVSTSSDFRSSDVYALEWSNQPKMPAFGLNIWIYTGPGAPKWMHETNGLWIPGFQKVGRVYCKTENLPVTKLPSRDGNRFYELQYKIGISFGGLEIKARIESVDGSWHSVPVAFRANDVVGDGLHPDADVPSFPKRKTPYPDRRFKYIGQN